MKPIIFLDFDGVLNNDRTFWAPKSKRAHPLDEPLELHLITRVAGLVAATDADIVLSTAWRNHHDLNELKRMLAPAIHPSVVIGKTPNSQTRGFEILTWLYESRRNALRFVVLDDNDRGQFDMGPVRAHFVQTDPAVGISRGDVRRAKRMLEAGPIWQRATKVA